MYQGASARGPIRQETDDGLVGDAWRRREVEPERYEDQLIELERPVLGVDLLIGEGRVRTRAAGVEATTVVRERERPVLDVEADEVRRIERQSETERRRYRDAIDRLEARRIRAR